MKLDFCCACGSTENLHHHHLMPKSLGGSDDEENLITLCGVCHGVIHGHNPATWVNHRELTRKGLARTKAAGTKLGRPVATGTRQAVRDARASGMTQAKAAKELKLSLATVKRYWNDKGAE